MSDLSAPAEPLDFPRMAASRLPNAWLVCPAGYCGSANEDSPVYGVPAAALRAAWDAMISQQPRVELVRSDRDGRGGTWVQRSEKFGFRDRINVRFLALPGGRSTLAVHSRSETGLYDFGVNRRRIAAWLAPLAALSRPFDYTPDYSRARPEAPDLPH